MMMQAKGNSLLGFGLTVALVLSAFGSTEAAPIHAAPANFDSKTLASVESLYGLGEEGAISRLAKEGEAARQDRIIRSMNLTSYAGSWFDPSTMRLCVAISDSADSAAVLRAGAIPVIVRYSLVELKRARNEAIAVANSSLNTPHAVRESYIDVRANQVVIDVAAFKTVAAAKLLSQEGNNPQLVRVAHSAKMDFSTNYVRGADGTRNATWAQVYGGVHPCSIGVSIVGGYATAGHCGSAGDTITTAGGTLLGTVDQSSFDIGSYTFANNEDGAWIATNSNWTPVPQVNGYNDGTLQVNPKWGGTEEVSVGFTVCRYGQTSGGPHCGTVAAQNVTQTFSGTSTIQGLTEVHGVCTANGDSGGTIITPSGQIQGTNTGGNAGSSGNSCPDDSTDVDYFQPIKTTLDRFGLTVLTTHGSNPPSVNGFTCPNTGDSGLGAYVCGFDSYDSQGATSYSWTSNTGNSGTITYFAGHCYPRQTVHVNLAVTNPYGTTNKSVYFSCPENARH